MGVQTTALGTERAALLEILEQQREFLRYTLRGLDDQQAAQRATASELTLGSTLKHVIHAERSWAEFVIDESPDLEPDLAELFAQHQEGFTVRDGETLAALLAEYQEVARETERIFAELPNLEVNFPLPKTPWRTQEHWTARHILVHLIRETAQHCGHADIIRETLDGQKTMG